MSYLLPGRSHDYYRDQSRVERFPLKLLAMVALGIAVVIGGSVYGLHRAGRHAAQEQAPVAQVVTPARDGAEEQMPPDIRADLAGHARSTERYLSGCLAQLDAAEKELNKFRDVHADSSIDRAVERLQAARRDAVRAREQSTTVRALTEDKLGRAH